VLAVLLKSKFFTYLFTVDANDNSSTAWPVTVVNTIMAESLRFMADEIQKKVDSRIPLDDAINSTVIETLKKHYAIVFNGNGYSEEWVVEAGTRGLPILKHPYEALGVLDQPEKVDLFKNYGVLSPAGKFCSISHIISGVLMIA
jgi:glutamine synthetase